MSFTTPQQFISDLMIENIKGGKSSILFYLAGSSFFETHFKVKSSGKILRRFDLTEIIFKYKKKK